MTPHFALSCDLKRPNKRDNFKYSFISWQTELKFLGVSLSAKEANNVSVVSLFVPDL